MAKLCHTVPDLSAPSSKSPVTMAVVDASARRGVTDATAVVARWEHIVVEATEGCLEQLVGTKVGNIQLLESLGVGGMGEVLLGVDERLGRRVAVKAIRADRRLDRAARARFQREARVLSRLEHANICRLYDLIEEDGRDFIVMELIEGRNLSDVIDENPSFAARLEIARQVATALVAAHAVSVVHRDLKPENIVVTPEGQVKVLDFGLARSEGSAGVEDEEIGQEMPTPTTGIVTTATLTRDGTVIGTPRFMSPEQARGESPTAAADMYSFGLVLHELFSATPPHPPDLEFGILLQRAMWGETEALVGVDGQVADLIRELESLEPHRRPSASAAAQRLQRIAGRPRRRALWAAAAVVGVVLAVAAAVSTVGFVRASRSERAARDAQAQTEAVNRFLNDMLASARPGAQGVDVKVIEVLEAAAPRVERDFAGHPLELAAVEHTIGTTYQQLGRYGMAEEHLAKAASLRKEHLGREHRDTLSSLAELANAMQSQGRYPEAEQLQREVLGLRERLLGRSTSDALDSCARLGKVLERQGRYDEAEAQYRDGLARLGETAAAREADAAKLKSGLSVVLSRQGRDAEAAAMLREVIEVRKRLLGPEHPDTLGATFNLGVCLAKQGQLAEAERVFRELLALTRRVFGDQHPQVVACLINLGNSLLYQRRFEEAVECFSEASTIARSTLGLEHHETLGTLGNLANALGYTGRIVEAEALHREIIAAKTRTLGPDHPDTLMSMQNLAVNLDTQGHGAEAEQLYRQVLEGRSRALGPQHPETLSSVRDLCQLLRKGGRVKEAAGLEKRYGLPATSLETELPF